eukprot:4362689-Pyramimonas_sp.AAC.1
MQSRSEDPEPSLPSAPEPPPPSSEPPLPPPPPKRPRRTSAPPPARAIYTCNSRGSSFPPTAARQST